MQRGNVFTSVCQEFCSWGEVYTPKQTDTPRQTATCRWGKIMFYTCLQFYSGGWYPSMPCRLPGSQPGGAWGLEGSGQVHTQGKSWGVWLRGSPGPHPGESLGPYPGGSRSTLGGVSQHALRQTPQQMATAAGGTHSTGMHSCFFF